MSLGKVVAFRMAYIFLGCIMMFSSCTNTKKIEDKSSWPVVKLPEQADTTSPYWKGIDLEPKPPVLPLSVEEQQEKFLLPPGYELEPVLTEPKIQQPAAITFDG